MVDKLSSAAARILFLARLEAGRLKVDKIDTPHLLLGFIDNDRGTGALSDPNLYVAADGSSEGNVRLRHHSEIADPYLNSEVASSLRPLLLTTGFRDQPYPAHGDMMLSERAQILLASAVAFAGTDRVTPLHLFWAMLGEEQGEVAHLLVRSGFSRTRVESDIRERIRR